MATDQANKQNNASVIGHEQAKQVMSIAQANESSSDLLVVT
jgi:hypothetical protein